MTPQVKTFLLLFLVLFLLLFVHSPSGNVESFQQGTQPANHIKEVIIQMNARKLMMADAELDYDEGGPNPRHDPRKGKPPGNNGGKSL